MSSSSRRTSAERDADDLVTLFDLCGFASVDDALDDVEQTLGPLPLTPKTVYLLRELLEPEV